MKFSGCRAGMHKTWRHGGMSSCAAPGFFTARGRRSSSRQGALPVLQWVAFRVGPPAGPGLLGDVPGFFRSMVAWGVRAGPGPGPGPGPVPGPVRARGRLALQGFRRQAGGAAAGLPDFGTPGSAHTVLTRTGHSVAVSALLWCVCCLDELARVPRSRLGEGVLLRRLRAALWEPCGATRLWPRRAPAPFLCSEQCAGQGRARAVGFVAGRSRWA